MNLRTSLLLSLALLAGYAHAQTAPQTASKTPPATAKATFAIIGRSNQANGCKRHEFWSQATITATALSKATHLANLHYTDFVADAKRFSVCTVGDC